MSQDTHQNASLRNALARELQGHGVEFGPGCHPLPVGPFVKSVRYCDVHDRASFAALFPEAADAVHHFPERVDYRLQFDREPFADVIGKGSLDFVIANHLLEHLVNPIGFLEQCYQVLSPGGILYLGLPDKRRIFDRDRRRTTLGDLLARYDAGVKEVSDERIAEFVNHVDRPSEPLVAGNPAQQAEFEIQRQRSIHVNVWVLDDIVELFQHVSRHQQMTWALYDGAVDGDEFLLLMRKTDRSEAVEQYPIAISRLYAEANRRAIERPTPADLAMPTITKKVAELEDRIAEVCRFVRGVKKVAGAIPGSPLLKSIAKRAG